MNTTTQYVIGAVISLGVTAAIGAWIGTLGEKKNGALGGALGGLLGPIGWIITAVLPANAGSRGESRDSGGESVFPLAMAGLGIATLVLIAGIVWMRTL